MSVETHPADHRAADRRDPGTDPEYVDPTRRDFLYIATGMAGVIGVAGFVWPFIDQMNPAQDTLALASVRVNVGGLEEGQSMTVKWRGKGVFVRKPTADEIEEAAEVPLEDLKDPLAANANLADGADGPPPATVENRMIVPEGGTAADALLVMMGVCTHLGCVPLGQQGDYDGWFCPCHGSHYDTVGRIRSGPAPTNLPIPQLAFVGDGVIEIG